MFLNSPQIIPLKVKTNLETCFALQQIHCRYTIFSYKFCLSIKGRHPWNEADKQHFFVWTNWFFCSWPTWKKSPNCPILTEKKKNSLFNFFLNENILIFGIWNLKATKLETKLGGKDPKTSQKGPFNGCWTGTQIYENF